MANPSPKPAYIPHAWETVPCPFGGRNSFSVYEQFGSNMPYRYVCSSHCSLVYSSPRPVYNKTFIDAAHRDSYQYSATLTLEKFTEVKVSGVDLFRKELQHLPKFDQKRTAVLDIGTGMGTFLYAAKELYPVCVGIDISEKMAAFVREELKVEVQVVAVEQFTYPLKFSLIHRSHVLEQVPNPGEWLKKVQSLLDEKGILVINVPHTRSLGSRMQHAYVRMGIKQQCSDAWKDPSRTPDHLFETALPAMKYLLAECDLVIMDHFTYSRRDPASNRSWRSRPFNRWLHRGSNLSFINKAKSHTA